MSLKYQKLCARLTLENYGKNALKVLEELQWGPKTLALLISATGLPASMVKKSLCVLIQYGFVVFEPGKILTKAEYTLVPEKTILLLRYPRYMKIINEKWGEASMLLFTEVLTNGTLTASKAISAVWDKIQDGALENYNDGVQGLRQLLHQLIVNQYLMCCPSVQEVSDSVPSATVEESQLYQPPELPLKELNAFINGNLRGEIADCNIFWRVNFDRVHQDMRDQLMIQGITNRVDENAGTLMGILLKLMYLRTDPWATQSNPIPYVEVKEAVESKNGNTYLSQFLEQYLRVIEEDDSNFIRKQGEGSTCYVYVNVDTAIHNLTVAAVETLVGYRFGPKAARIFRIVNDKKYIDQEQLQKLAMVPDKEAKQLTYRMLQENFLHMQELRKSGSAGPSKNFYLFHVDFSQVIQVVLEMCYKGVYNMLARAQHEKRENLRLMEKHEKLSSIAECMREQGTEEEQIKELVDEWMTPPERGHLELIGAMIKKLQIAEIHVDDTIFLLHLFTYYEAINLRQKK